VIALNEDECLKHIQVDRSETERTHTNHENKREVGSFSSELQSSSTTAAALL
jgi:hypothetical protein